MYPVQVGDELKRIAARYNVTTQTLYTTNRDVIGNNPDLIYPGQHLDVCFGRQYAAAAQSVPNPVTAPATYDIRNDIMTVFGRYGNQAIHIATCESGLTPSVVNSIPVWVGGTEQHAGGVFQILQSSWEMTPYWKDHDRFDPHWNIVGAYWLFHVRDHNDWSIEWSTWRCAIGY